MGPQNVVGFEKAVDRFETAGQAWDRWPERPPRGRSGWRRLAADSSTVCEAGAMSDGIAGAAA